MVWRPVAEVLLVVGERVLGVEMYIDSGADLSMIPYGLGRALGLQRNPGEPLRRLGGIAGSARYLLKSVTMKMGSYAFPVRVAWTMNDQAPLLLGRLDVFQKFRITFEEAKRVVKFRLVGKQP